MTWEPKHRRRCVFSMALLWLSSLPCSTALRREAREVDASIQGPHSVDLDHDVWWDTLQFSSREDLARQLHQRKAQATGNFPDRGNSFFTGRASSNQASRSSRHSARYDQSQRVQPPPTPVMPGRTGSPALAPTPVPTPRNVPVPAPTPVPTVTPRNVFFEPTPMPVPPTPFPTPLPTPLPTPGPTEPTETRPVVTRPPIPTPPPIPSRPPASGGGRPTTPEPTMSAEPTIMMEFPSDLPSEEPSSSRKKAIFETAPPTQSASPSAEPTTAFPTVTPRPSSSTQAPSTPLPSQAPSLSLPPTQAPVIPACPDGQFFLEDVFLIDATLEFEMRRVRDGAVIPLLAYGFALTLEARWLGFGPGSVEFLYPFEPRERVVDNGAPYTLDTRSTFSNYQPVELTPGNWNLTVTPFCNPNAAGTPGGPANSIQFTVADSIGDANAPCDAAMMIETADSLTMTVSNVEAEPLLLTAPGFRCSSFFPSSQAVYYEVVGNGVCYRVNTFGSFIDTVLGVLEGTDCAFATCLTTNDNTDGFQSEVAFATLSDRRYWVVVGGFLNTIGDIAITFNNVPCDTVPPPPTPAPTISDPFAQCNMAESVTLRTGLTLTGSNIDAEPVNYLSPAAVCFDFFSGSNAIYFSFMGDGECYEVNSFNSNFDTVLGAIQGDTCDAVNTCVVSNDDADGVSQSQIQVRTTAGVPYYLIVAGYSDNVGSFELAVMQSSCTFEPTTAPVEVQPTPEPTSFDPFSVCNRAPSISLVAGLTFNGTNIDSPSLSFQSPAFECPDFFLTARTLYYEFMGDGGCYTVDTFGSSYDTVLGILRGDSCETTTCIESNDDFQGVSPSQVAFSSTAGVRYYLLVGGFGSARGSFTVTVNTVDCTLSPTQSPTSAPTLLPEGPTAPPTSFDPFGQCNLATPITLADEPVLSGSTVNAALAGIGSPAPRCSLFVTDNTRTAYFAFVGDGEPYTINTEGSDFDTILGLLQGTDCTDAFCIDLNDDFGGPTSQISFLSGAGLQYYLVIGGFGTRTGNFEINIRSNQPTVSPTTSPTLEPQPSSNPSIVPTIPPSKLPTSEPSDYPSGGPSLAPTRVPSASPSLQPTGKPSQSPSLEPSGAPSLQPTSLPTTQPSETPTRRPSTQPSSHPSALPTITKSESPSSSPTKPPTATPTVSPTFRPTTETAFPTSLTSAPTPSPSANPTGSPSAQPSGRPSSRPSLEPTNTPSQSPSGVPSSPPSAAPTGVPTGSPSGQPTGKPTGAPSSTPSSQPSSIPTASPSSRPSPAPSSQPTGIPSATPSNAPTGVPSFTPTDPVLVKVLTILTVRTDNNPLDITLDLSRSGSTRSLISAGTFEDANTDVTFRASLGPGLYTLVINDRGGDGICCENGLGFFLLNVDGVDLYTGARFGSSIQVQFTVSNTAAVELLTPQPSVYGLQPSCNVVDTEAFNICLFLEGTNDVNPAWLTDFATAVATWERVISGDDMFEFGTSSANIATETPEMIDDVYIVGRAEPVDGRFGILGYAKPVLIFRLRKDGLQFIRTRTGDMVFDSADIELELEEGAFFGTVLHEMGHVLGIGTLWTLNNLYAGSGADYFGDNANREYVDYGFPGTLPVETDGGRGTAGGHWDEACLQDELMTGFSNGASNPLSRITIGGLDDLGYLVNYTAADPYDSKCRCGLTGPTCEDNGRRLGPEENWMFGQEWRMKQPDEQQNEEEGGPEFLPPRRKRPKNRRLHPDVKAAAQKLVNQLLDELEEQARDMDLPEGMEVNNLFVEVLAYNEDHEIVDFTMGREGTDMAGGLEKMKNHLWNKPQDIFEGLRNPPHNGARP